MLHIQNPERPFSNCAESSVVVLMLDQSNNSAVALLDIGINLGKGPEEHIIVHEGDTPEGVAESFCLNHKLGPKQKAMLIDQIQKAIKEELNPQLSQIYPNISEAISENINDDITDRRGRFSR